jgi:hypothetical protein
MTMAALTVEDSVVDGTRMAASTADDPRQGTGRCGQDKDVIVEVVPWVVHLPAA